MQPELSCITKQSPCWSPCWWFHGGFRSWLDHIVVWLAMHFYVPIRQSTQLGRFMRPDSPDSGAKAQTIWSVSVQLHPGLPEPERGYPGIWNGDLWPRPRWWSSVNWFFQVFGSPVFDFVVASKSHVSWQLGAVVLSCCMSVFSSCNPIVSSKFATTCSSELMQISLRETEASVQFATIYLP